jgi:hypothetical protein
MSQVPPAMSSAEQQQIVDWEKQYFPTGVNSVEDTLIQDEFSAQASREMLGNPYGGLIGGWDGFKLPKGISPDDLTSALNYATSFANATGWQYFPKAMNVLNLIKQGPMTQEQAFQYFAQYMTPSARGYMPWVMAGMDKQTYTDQMQTYNEAMNTLTGTTFAASGLPPSILQNAMQGNWSMTRFQQEIQNNAQAQKAFGWLSHGLTYQQFTQSITANKAALEQRYGVGNANKTTALNDLNNPLVGFGSYGAAISEPDTSKSSTMNYGQSTVR